MTHLALSVVVVVHASARQTENVLLSLSPSYQQGITEPYEVCVVEAASDDLLGEARARSHGEHVRYVTVDGSPGWRARAIAAGVATARAPLLGLLQDGAHVVTPRVLGLATGALRNRQRGLVVVADYALDETKVPAKGNADLELAWLSERRWIDSPYSLLAHAAYGPAAANGPLSPILGASVMFFPRASLDAIAGIDPALDQPGTGVLRVHLFTQLCRLRGTELVSLAGEAAIRQTHPEVATDSVRWDEASVERLMVGAVLPQGPGFEGVHREPLRYGEVGAEARPHVERSAVLAEWHCAVCRNKGVPSWYEDPPATPA